MLRELAQALEDLHSKISDRLKICRTCLTQAKERIEYF